MDVKSNIYIMVVPPISLVVLIILIITLVCFKKASTKLVIRVRRTLADPVPSLYRFRSTHEQKSGTESDKVRRFKQRTCQRPCSDNASLSISFVE